MSKDYWKLADEEYEFIKGEVCHIFEMFQLKCVPVSGFEIASKMGIKVIAFSGLSKKKLVESLKVSEDGFLIEKDGQEFIFYNDINRSHERQNWTILHEIGHIVLDHTGYSEHEEDEANFFAKYAIAPPVLIHKIGATSFKDVYEAFDISMEAAWYAFDYYKTWKLRYIQTKHLAKYEIRLLALYKRSA